MSGPPSWVLTLAPNGEPAPDRWLSVVAISSNDSALSHCSLVRVVVAIPGLVVGDLIY